VKVTALSVTAPEKNEEGRRSMNDGTSLTIKVTQPGKFILALDEDASKVASFTDDKGANLLVKSPSGREGIWPFPEISKDGHSVSVKVQSPAIPTAGAAAIQLKGALVLTCGADEKTASQQDVDIKKDATLSAGALSAKVESVEENKWGDEKSWMVSLQSDKDFAAIKALALVGADGKEIEGRLSGSGRMGFMGKASYNRDYAFKVKPGKMTVKVTYFDKTEKVTVPVDLSVSVGL
jgi:hypothetical protein